MKKIISLFTTALVLLTLSPLSFAINMDQAKSQGLVGETSQGYLGSVKTNPSADIKALVKSINQQRKVAFATKAAKAGVSLDVMAKRVAQRLFQKAVKGNYLKNSAGKWYKK